MFFTGAYSNNVFPEQLPEEKELEYIQRSFINGIYMLSEVFYLSKGEEVVRGTKDRVYGASHRGE